MVVGKRIRFARALSFPSFALVWSGQTISGLGDAAFYTAVAWQVLLLTGSATAIGVVMIAQTVPRLVLSLVGGAYADRLPRRLVMLVSDCGRMLAVGAIAALGLAGVLQLWHIVALATVFGVADAFFAPAYLSIPPQIVDTEALPSANSLTAVSQQVSQLVGPAIAAACITVSSPSLAFAFDALTFLVSALTLVFAHIPPLAPRTSEGTEGATGEDARKPSIVRDIGEGIRYVFATPWLWVSIAVFSVANIGIAPLMVALPILVKDVYHAGVWLLSASLIVGAIGSLVATLVVGQMKRMHHRGLIVYSCTIFSGLALAAFGVPAALTTLGVAVPSSAGVAAILAGSVIFSAGVSVFTVLWYTIMQEMVPANLLGRVNSIDWLGSFAFMPVGLGIAGILSDQIGPAWVFIAGGALVAALSVLGLMVKDVRGLN